MTTDLTTTTRYSQVAPASEVAEIQRLILGMTTAGWSVGSDGRSRAPTDQERFAVASVCHRLGLDPLLGDVELLGSRVYVTAAAVERRIAERVDIQVTARPATAEERDAHDLGEGEVLWIAEAVQTLPDGRERRNIGYGYASRGDVGIAKRQGVDDVSARRLVRNVAEKRARSRAVRPIIGLTEGADDAPLIVAPMAAITNSPVAQLVESARAQLVAEPVQTVTPPPVATPTPAPTPPPAPAETPTDDREATLARWLDSVEGRAMHGWIRDVWLDDPDTRETCMRAVKGRHSPARFRTDLADLYPLPPLWEIRAWISSLCRETEARELTDAWSAVEEDVLEARLVAIRAAKAADRLAVIRDVPRTQE